MTKLKVRMRFFFCGSIAVLCAACGGQNESDALISATQNQFYARTMQAQAAETAARTTPPATLNDEPAAAPEAKVEAIPAMPIPDSLDVPAAPVVPPSQPT